MVATGIVEFRLELDCKVELRLVELSTVVEEVMLTAEGSELDSRDVEFMPIEETVKFPGAEVVVNEAGMVVVEFATVNDVELVPEVAGEPVPANDEKLLLITGGIPKVWSRA